MNRLGTFIGLIILLAGAFGVYSLFQDKPAAEEAAEPEIATQVAVQVAKVQKADLHGYVRAYGTVELDPGDGKSAPASVRITAPSAGIITEARCAEGQQVKKGDILFRLDSRIADVSIEKARQAVSFAEKNFARQQKLRAIQGTSDKLYLEAQQALEAARAELAGAQTQRTLLAVVAPFSGTIVSLDAKVGETVNMAQDLAELRDLKRMVVSATVPSREVGRLKLGQVAEIDTGMLPGVSAADADAGADDSTTETRKLSATLDYIDPQLNPENDTVTVRTAVPAGSDLRPGQFVAMRIAYEEHVGCLAMPEEGVVVTPEGQTVVALVEGDMAVKKTVRAGLRDGGLVEIAGDGIKEGASVVTVGAYGLPEKTKIRIVGQ
ncbi:MAG: efflux RND transporter periplasmic adaptor subunit [bacterium]|nr:efflux RND transporter periplasmic adaptor subunit [bacterium]